MKTLTSPRMPSRNIIYRTSGTDNQSCFKLIDLSIFGKDFHCVRSDREIAIKDGALIINNSDI